MFDLLFRKTILKLLRFYQKYFSPDTSFFSLLHPFFGACKFKPTCSEYACQAIEKYGVIRGIIKSLNRLLRCHPFSRGGYDPLK